MQSGINRRVGRVMASRPMNLSHVEKLFERRKLAFQLGEWMGGGILSAKTIRKSREAFHAKKIIQIKIKRTRSDLNLID